MITKKHELYNHFNEKEIVYIKSKDELEPFLSKYDQSDHYLKFAGEKTKINQRLHHCCTLDIDKQYTWSYDWISKKPNNYFDDDLFEL